MEAFTSAAITALQELTGVAAYVEPNPKAALVSEIVVSATVRLMRPIPGKMTLVLTAEAASRLAAMYLPSGTTLTEEMIDDVVGEFANVIAGQSKTILKGTPFHFTLSTPVVVRMASFDRLPGIAAGTLVAALAFEAEKLLLVLELCPCPGA